MSKMAELYRTADWKSEKHVPVIEAPTTVAPDTSFEVKVTIGKEISHPNTTEHHIRWVQLFFHAEGEKFPCQIGSFEFTAHGESTEGPNKGSVSTDHQVIAALRLKKSGLLIATSLCNIHGLWESAMSIEVR